MRKWVEDVSALVRALPVQYGENKILPAEGSPPILDELTSNYGLPLLFRDWFQVCGGLSLNDFHNGYWLWGFEEIYHRYRFGDINRIEGAITSDVLIIGGRGGGGDFVVRTDGSGEILYLPSGGRVERSVWRSDSDFNAPEVISPDFPDFLERLLDDFRAFIRQDQNWKYISSH